MLRHMLHSLLLVTVVYSQTTPIRDGAVRLSGSSLQHEGRLEVFYNGEWGTVCDDEFDEDHNGATVACRSLGYSYGLMIGHRYGPNYDLSIIMDDVQCQGTEESLLQCRHRPLGTHNCGHHEDVSISCVRSMPSTSTIAPVEMQIRLIGSVSRREGRLEVFHNDTWGTVCDDYFDEAAAMVACFSLGFGRVGQITINAGSYSSTTQIWLDDVRCHGNETSLVQCQHTEWGQHNCGHAEDIYLSCVPAIRLVGSNLLMEGRLEVFYQGSWGTVCNHNFDDLAASVACFNLGFERIGRRLYDRSYPGGVGNIWLDDVLCNGQESTLTNCIHGYWGYNNCNHSMDVNIQCFDGTLARNETMVRLNGNGNPRQGRLEILHDGTWGTVCDRNFNAISATVACRSLGFGSAGELLYNYYGPGSGRIWLTDVVCTGSEHTIVDCQHGAWGSEMSVDGGRTVRCDHSSDISIACYQEVAPVNVTQTVRLVGGASGVTSEGRLEVYVDRNRTWSTVCHHNFDDADARVACYSLGFGRVGTVMAGGSYRGGRGSILLDSFSCVGYESSLLECPHRSASCDHSEDVAVACYPENITVIDGVGVRLAGNGSQPRQGRLEVFHNGIWGTVCGNNFDDQDAQVACNSLGFGHVGYTLGNFFGPGTGRIWLNNLACFGYERSLADCRHSGWGLNTCMHTGDVSIACYSGVNSRTEVRLVGASYGQGRLEVRHQGVWGSVCNDAFTDRDAQVACNMLGFNNVGRTLHRRYGSIYNRILLDGINCVGSESNFDDCSDAQWTTNDCDLNDEVSITCWLDADPFPPSGYSALVGLAIATSVLSIMFIVLLICCCRLRKQNANFRTNPFSLFTPPTDDSTSNGDDEFLLAA